MVGLDKPFETEAVLAVTVETLGADQGLLRSLHLHLLTASALFVCFTIAGLQFVRAEGRILLQTVYTTDLFYPGRVIELRFTSKFDGSLFIQDVIVNRGNCVGSTWTDLDVTEKSVRFWLMQPKDPQINAEMLETMRKRRTAKWGQTVTIKVPSCTLLEVKAVTNRGTFTWEFE